MLTEKLYSCLPSSKTSVSLVMLRETASENVLKEI